MVLREPKPAAQASDRRGGVVGFDAGDFLIGAKSMPVQQRYAAWYRSSIQSKKLRQTTGVRGSTALQAAASNPPSRTGKPKRKTEDARFIPRCGTGQNERRLPNAAGTACCLKNANRPALTASVNLLSRSLATNSFPTYQSIRQLPQLCPRCVKVCPSVDWAAYTKSNRE